MDDGHGAPVSPSGNFNIPILELFDSFARPTPTIEIYNPLRTNDVARDIFTNNADWQAAL